MGVTVSSSHVVSAAPSSSGGGLFILFPCSSVRSLSRETVLHELLQRESFPRAAALHKQLQHGFFPWSSVFQEQAAPAWVPHGVKSPASKTSAVWAPLSTGPQVLPGACSSMGFPQGHSILQASTCSGVRFLPRGYLLHRGPPWAAGQQPASPWSSPRAAGESLQGNLRRGISWSTSSPFFLIDIGVCRVVSLTYSHFSPQVQLHSRFLPFLNMLSQRRYHHR